MSFNTEQTERMRIDSSGNVGIGTSSPAEKLDVNGNIKIPTTSYIDIGSAGGNNTLYLGKTSSSTGSIARQLQIRGRYSSGDRTLTLTAGGSTTNAIIDASSDLILQSSSGNVFIGGTSSTSKPTGLNKAIYLQSQTDGDVIGYSLYTNEGTNNRRASFFLDDTNGVFGFDASASSGVPQFVINSVGTERLRIDSSGNVGVGTSSPTSVANYNSISVNGTTGSLVDSYYGGTLGGRIQAYSSKYFISAQGASLPLTFGTNNTERMRITSGGNILVGGTTDRNRKLVVEGTGDLLTLYSTNTGAGGAQLDLKHDSSSAADDDAIGIINFSTDDRQYSSIRGIAHSHSSGHGHLRFGVRTNTSTYNHDAMTLDESGYLGIGTTSPDALLHLNDSGNTQLRLTTTQDSNTPTAQIAYSAGSGYFLRLGDSANNEDIMLRTYGNSVFNGGNVGIGTSSPATILHIESDTNDWATAPMLYFGSTSTANAAVRDWAIGPADSDYGNFHFNVGSSTGASPVAANNHVMVLTSAKKVGIGMTNPAYTLDVNGNLAFRASSYAYDAAFYAYDSTNGTYLGYDTTTGGRGRITMTGAQDLLLQTNGGNVGIGNTDAHETLHLTATAPEIKMTNSSMNYHIRSYNNNFNIVPQNATYGLSISSNGEVCVGNSTDSSSLRRARRFNVEGNGSNKDGVHVMNYNGANTYQCAYHMMTAAGSTIYAHIETSISTQSNIMFRAHFTGYNYGTSSVIDMHGVGYAYQPNNAVISGQAVNNGGDTNQALAYYTSNNNRVVLRFKVGASSSYYCGFLLHMEFAQPTGYNHEFTIVNASWTSSSANQY